MQTVNTAMAYAMLVLGASVAYGESITYERFAAAVMEQSPEHTIQATTAESAAAAIGRAGNLPDPQLSFGRDRVPLKKESLMELEPNEAARTVTLTQNIPWPGALGAEEDAAEAFAAVNQTDLKVGDVTRALAAKDLFLRMVRLAKLIEIQRSHLSEAEAIREFAHARFRQGLGSHMEFIQSHSESALLKANIAAFDADLDNLRLRALLMMGRPLESGKTEINFVLQWPDAAPGNHSNNSPDLVRQRLSELGRVEIKQKDASYRRSLPSFSASGMLMREDEGMRMYGAAIGVSLPVFSWSERRAISSESALTERRVSAELSWHDQRKKLALAQLASREKQIESNLVVLRTEIIPPVREHLAAAMTEYSQGKGRIGSIVEGRRTLLSLQSTELQQTEALAQAVLGRERIEAGFVDAELDIPVPQLAGIPDSSMQMGGGMGMSMPMERRGGSELKRPLPGARQLNQPSSAPNSNEPAKGYMPGMGM